MPSSAARCVAIFFVSCCVSSAGAADVLTSEVTQRIFDRYRQVILLEPDRNTVPVDSLLQTLSKEGTWPDLDYADKHPARWQPKEHLYRVRSMAIQLVRDGQSPEQAEMQRAINSAIDHWLEKKYRCPNWWSNEIGTPQALRDLIVLLGDRLSEERRAGMIKLMQLTRIHGTGANLLWQAEIVFHRELLQGNEPELATAVNRVWQEIRVSDKEGIQTDWSFHQHGKRLQSFGYGRNFLNVAVNLAWQLHDTPWAMPDEKQEIVSNYLLEGLQWMSRGTYCPPGTFDRVVSRQDSKRSANLIDLLPRWAEVEALRRKEIEAFLAHQQGAAAQPRGYRHFPQSDFTAYHRPAGSIFLKTISDRTLATESIIGENVQGKPFLHSGDHYVVRDGKEFFDLAPVLKWNRLPGITTAQIESKQTRTDFVGGLGNGESGMTAMVYVRETEKRPVVALRKTWFFHGDTMLCLLADRQQRSPQTGIVTSIEQCRLQSPVTVGALNGETQVLPEGDHSLKNTRWVLHNNVGYLPIEPSEINLYLGEAKGSWSAINSRYQDEPNSVTDRIFRIELPHADHCPAGFVVVLNADANTLNAICSKPDWQVLRNDADCQAIRFAGGLTMATFYQPGSIDAEPGISVKSSCLLMARGDEVWLCDPTNRGKELAFTVGKHKQKVELPAGGTAAKL